jgi:hypothetical protein
LQSGGKKPARDASSLRQQLLDLTAEQAELVKNLSDWALPGKQWVPLSPSIRRGQRDRGNVMDVISSASDRDALRARIRDQSRAVADHIAADAQARSFIDNWATPEPLSR